MTTTCEEKVYSVAMLAYFQGNAVSYTHCVVGTDKALICDIGLNAFLEKNPVSKGYYNHAVVGCSELPREIVDFVASLVSAQDAKEIVTRVPHNIEEQDAALEGTLVFSASTSGMDMSELHPFIAPVHLALALTRLVKAMPSKKKGESNAQEQPNG